MININKTVKGRLCIDPCDGDKTIQCDRRDFTLDELFDDFVGAVITISIKEEE